MVFKFCVTCLVFSSPVHFCHLFCFQETMVLRPRLVVSIDDINEGSRDVVFESKVMCRYGNWVISKEHKFPYLHCDLIDRAGFTTITVSLKHPKIEQHKEKLHVGSFV
jgi:hypothetical protein